MMAEGPYGLLYLLLLKVNWIYQSEGAYSDLYL